jgi:hypothetical protein
MQHSHSMLAVEDTQISKKQTYATSKIDTKLKTSLNCKADEYSI